jgi:flagellar motor switch protein FliN/FliY
VLCAAPHDLYPMIVDHDEIEALLAQTDRLVTETDDDASAAAPGSDAAAPRSMSSPRLSVDVSPKVTRILRVRVPVRVQLAARRMSIGQVRKLSLGMIIEFHKPVGDPLDLLINNRPVGKGDAVKVGERFGLRVSEIGDAATRIRSMGG